MHDPNNPYPVDDPLSPDSNPSYQDASGHWWDWDPAQVKYVQRADTRTNTTVDPRHPPPATTSSTYDPSNPAGVTGGGDFQAPTERFPVSAWESGMPLFMPDRFEEPDPMDAMKDPSYDWEQREGVRALEQGAASRGVLNGGGTLKDINAWGQNFATSRVADVRNRAVQRYQLNYQAALDAFTARMSGWQTQGQVGQRQNEDDWIHAYTPWNDQWNRRVTVATA